MFQKILIAEDQITIPDGLKKPLNDLSIDNIKTSQYCDDALLKIKAALRSRKPFDLLITDLSFKEDHRSRDLTSGEELIKAVKEIQPDLKIIVFSVEHRVGKIKKLLEAYHVNGYVEKGRNEYKMIIEAIETVLKGEIYCSQNIKLLLRNEEEISQTDQYDELLLQLLAKGLKRDQIAVHFKEKDLPARSLSSIEKRINKLKILFDAQTSEQLVAIAIYRGLI